MTIADKLQYLGETKTLIKEAIQNKGVSVSDTDPFRVYADKISQIQTGGGSGGEVIEAIVDDSALPIKTNKKVIVVDTQAPGQGAGAITAFSLVPYAVNGYIQGITRLPDGRVLMNHSKQGNTADPYASLICKQVGDQWDCEYTSLKLPGGLCLNDKFALLYDFANTKDNPNYPDPLQFGSSGKYLNLKTLTVESITFDETIPANTNSNYVTKYFLSHDSKYLWGTQMYTTNTNSSDSTVAVPLWVYKVHINEEDGKVSATKLTESTVSITTYAYHCALLSLNHYGICIFNMYTSYSDYYAYKNMMYAEYDEATNSITHRTANGFWNTKSQVPIMFTKDWVLIRSTSANTSNVYKGDWFSAERISANINGLFTSFPNADSQRGINRIGNALFSDYTESYNSNGSICYVKVPVDKEAPTAEDFEVKQFTCKYEFACFLNEDEFLQTVYNAHTSMPLLKNVNGTTTTYDPPRVPIMLLDDGTGYFYEDNDNLRNYARVQLKVPVAGSYNNGVVLKTIDPSTYSTPFYKLINTASTQTGQGFRFGPLPMNYINGGESFIFHNYTHGTSSTDGVTFFKSAVDGPQKITNVSPKQGVRVSQNKAYITPYYNTASDNITSIIVCDEKGVNTYEVTTYGYNLQGVYFDFEGETYSYPLPNRADFTSQGNTFLKMHFDPDNLTCAWEKLGTTELNHLNQMSQYITDTDMAKSNPYPATGSNSLYDMPVITKDGKYFVGLAGNHTTHYAKIEKHESGLPMLNVYEFPQMLKDLLYGKEILYFEAYYPSGFGIQLANGTFLLCEYEQGLDVDLNITTYTPAHSYWVGSYNQCLMHFTSHKNYWFFSAGTSWSSGSIHGYAGCGRRGDLPSTHQIKVYSMKHNFTGADYVTGYLTGESYTDENGKFIARVEVLRK